MSDRDLRQQLAAQIAVMSGEARAAVDAAINDAERARGVGTLPSLPELIDLALEHGVAQS